MVFWRTMSGRVDLSTGEDWRIRANVEDEMDDKDLSDEELIRRFEVRRSEGSQENKLQLLECLMGCIPFGSSH